MSLLAGIEFVNDKVGNVAGDLTTLGKKVTSEYITFDQLGDEVEKVKEILSHTFLKKQ
jgi:hypothetical protein